jgi:hypothetical protein
MKRLSLVVAILASVATGVSAQSVNLTGVYRCVQICRGGLPAHVTQNGPQLNLLTEAGCSRMAGLVCAGDPNLDRRFQ